jgi:DNA-binding beta-propeller fold protein YncE
MSPNAASQDLLYVTDVGTRDVKVYSYPGGKLQGRLTGFSKPWGLCVDKAGDVFVTDIAGLRIFKFGHGKNKPMAVLKDPGEEPGGCAVDPTTGDLAVANVSTPYTGAGDLMVFPHAAGQPKTYHDSAIYFFQFCGYDNNGNLFVDGTKSSVFQLAELPAGQSSLMNVTLDKKMRFAGAVQWDGTSLAIGNYPQNAIYRFHVAGNKGTKIGSTLLKDANFAIGLWIDGSTVIGPNDDGANVMFWNYPQGGAHTKIIKGLGYPLAATVSLAPQ